MNAFSKSIFAVLSAALLFAALYGCGGESDPGALIYKNKPVDVEGDITLTTEDQRASVTFPATLFKTGAKVGLTGFSAATDKPGLPEGRVPIGAAEFKLIKPGEDDAPPPPDDTGGEGGDAGGEDGEGGDAGDGEGADGETEEPQDAIGGTVSLKLLLSAGHKWPSGSSLTLYKYSSSLKEWRDTGVKAPLSSDATSITASIDKFGTYAVMSPIISEIPPPAPSAPLVEVATKTIVRLTWSPLAYSLLSGYNVYRSSTADGEYVKANSDILVTPEFSEKPAAIGDYFYRITAVSTSDLESEMGGFVKAAVKGTDFYGIFDTRSGTAGELAQPWDAVVLPDGGGVLITDAGADKLVIFTPDGKFIRSIGMSGFGSFKFDTPKGAAVSSDGNRIYIADSGNSRIHIFNSSLTTDTVFGNSGIGNGNLNNPEGVAVRADGVVFVADTGNSRIQYFTPSGTYLGHFGEAGESALISPGFLSFSPEGSLYVSDRGGARIVKYSGDLVYETSLTFSGITNVPPLGIPSDMAFGAGGAMYFADSGVGRIIVADSSGEFDYLFGSRGSGNGKFGQDGPLGIAFDPAIGLLYVCDTANLVVQIFQP